MTPEAGEPGSEEDSQWTPDQVKGNGARVCLRLLSLRPSGETFHIQLVVLVKSDLDPAEAEN